MLPDLRRMPGLVDVFLGRRGPDELGPRLNVTVWTSREAMVAGVGENFDPPIFHPEYIDETTERVLEILPIAISMPFDGVGTPRILRTLHGTTQPGERAAYIEEARNGTIADIDAGRGPLALAPGDRTGRRRLRDHVGLGIVGGAGDRDRRRRPAAGRDPAPRTHRALGRDPFRGHQRVEEPARVIRPGVPAAR